MTIKKTSLLLAMALTGLTTGAVFAAPPGVVTESKVSTTPSNLTPKQRGQLTSQFVRKWGGYVQRIHGINAGTWSSRMVSQFATADSDNFRNALKRNTFEGALDTLNGTGHRMSDERVITKLANEQVAKASGNTKVFGALSNDLVYTPIAPCRIIDTRSTAAGAIAANSTRSFVAIAASNFTGQGGSATNCGTLSLNATAVAVNLTAVTPTNAGYATAFPFGTTQPVASSVNYTAGAIVNNALIVQIPNPLSSFDFTLYTFAQSHYVADIVGYFAPPVATALQCVNVVNTVATTVGPGSDTCTNPPACASGYTQTAAIFDNDGFGGLVVSQALVDDTGSSSEVCARNTGAASSTFFAGARCCRVPGR